MRYILTLRTLSLSTLAIAMTTLSLFPASARTELADIHSVAIVSSLGNTIDMQTQGTRFDYADYKLHTDWNLDAQIRAYLTQALASKFTIKNDAVDPQIFSQIDINRNEDVSVQASDIIKPLRTKPDVDAIILVLPDDTSPVGSTSPGLAVIHYAPFLFHAGTTTVAASYAVYIMNAKTGERIDYGTGKIPNSGYLFGHSPPWAKCSNKMWAKSEKKLSTGQRNRIRTEVWSLLTQSMPSALASANLMSKTDAPALTNLLTSAGDPSCVQG